MWHKYMRILLVLISVLFMLTGCTSSTDYLNEEIQELESRIEDLESENFDLRQENEELREKLDNINSIASDRNYNYSRLLDDVENESLY